MELIKTSSRSRLVIGIDFGVTSISVAYCLKTEDSQEENIEIISTWPGLENQHEAKIPAVLYYDPNQTVVGWGPDTGNALAPTGFPKPGFRKVNWFHRSLVSEFAYVDSTAMPALPPGKSSVDVVADYLSGLRTAIRSHLQAKLGETFNRLEKQIDWCFTNPAYVSSTQTAIRTAIVQAGYIKDDNDDNLVFTSETEAAFTWGIKTGLVPFYSNRVVLCVDCGVGLVKLLSYEMVNQNPLEFRETMATTDASCGGMAINYNFSNSLRAKLEKMRLPVGSRIVSRYYTINMADFEHRIKLDFRDNGQKWAVELPFEADFPEADIKEATMIWTNNEILECFEPVLKRIHELIKTQIDDVRAQNKVLENIMLLGGVAEIEFLFEQVKLYLPPQYKSKVLRSTNSGGATANGAVMVGLNKASERNKANESHGGCAVLLNWVFSRAP